MTVSERIYRILLKAYPPRYRRRYEEPMAQLFVDQLRIANTMGKLSALWLRTLADLVRTLPERHAETPLHLMYGLDDAQRVPRVRWSLAARKAVFFARYEASSFERKAITAEDLLLGILHEDRTLQELAGGAEAVAQIRREIQSREKTARREAPSEDLPLNAVSRSALELAMEQAPRAGAPEATPRHLLAGILQQEQTLAAQLLRRHGVDLERLRTASED